MSEYLFEYDPMSLQSDVDAVYTPEVITHNRMLHAISQGASERHSTGRRKFRMSTTIICPELFGSFGSDDSTFPPVAPPAQNVTKH